MRKFGLLFVFFVVFLSACGEGEQTNDPNQEEFYKVTFYDAEMDILKEETVSLGEDVLPPANPSKEGYTFSHWSEQTENVLSDLDVYPIFLPNMYSITYISIGEEVHQETGLLFEENLDDLYLPSREGHVFDGWFLDEELSQEFTQTAMPAKHLLLYAKWISTDSLEGDVLPYYMSRYGNTNGNLQNKGLVAYDLINNEHLYAIGHQVFTFNQETNETNLLFSLAQGGTVAYMNVYNSQVYFINRTNGYLMQYDRSLDTVEVISEKDYHFLMRDQSYLYTMSYETYYGEDLYVLRYYSLSSEQFNSSPIHTVEHVNVWAGRIYYTDIEGELVQLRSSNFMGRVSLVDLEDYGISAIHELLLVDVAMDYSVTLAMIGVKDEVEGFYIYKGEELLQVVQSSNLHNLNYNGEAYYYIDNGALMMMDVETQTIKELVQLDVNIDRLYVVNNWVYLGDEASGFLMRLHPDTLASEILSE